MGGGENSKQPRVTELIAGLPSDAQFSVSDMLRRYPQLEGDHDAVVILAYEEYCRRKERGEPIDVSEFVERFSSIRLSLLKLIDLDECFHRNSELAQELQQGWWPDVGDEFLGFELQEELGRGALSRVFVATERRMGDRRVVAKVCWRGVREASTLGRLEHPGVVPVYSIREDESTPLSVICMPLLSRTTLFHVAESLFEDPSQRPTSGRHILQAVRNLNPPHPGLKRSPLDSLTYADAVADIGRQLATALAYTHDRGVLHCDIKPTNVLLTPAGRAMLLDFNLSVHEGEADALPGGTLPYMAPEQLAVIAEADDEADALTADVRLDVYSLGATLYELLTGSSPCGAGSQAASRTEVARELLNVHLVRRIPPVAELNPAVPGQFAAVVDRCLSTDPAARPLSADEIAAALSDYLAPVKRARRWLRRNRIKLAVSVTAMLVAVVFFFSTPYGYDRGAAWGLLPRNLDFVCRHNIGLARDFMRSGDYVSAKPLLREVISRIEQSDATQRASETYTAHALLGECHVRLGNYTQAIEHLTVAATPGDDAVAHALLGFAYAKTGRFDQSFKHSFAAWNLGSKSDHIALNLATAAYKGFRFDELNFVIPIAQSAAENIESPESQLLTTHLNLRRLARMRSEILRLLPSNHTRDGYFPGSHQVELISEATELKLVEFEEAHLATVRSASKALELKQSQGEILRAMCTALALGTDTYLANHIDTVRESFRLASMSTLSARHLHRIADLSQTIRNDEYIQSILRDMTPTTTQSRIGDAVQEPLETYLTRATSNN